MTAYLYSEEAFRLLCHLCGASGWGGLDEQQAQQAAESLEQCGRVRLEGGQMRIEPISAYLFAQLAKPSFWLSEPDGGRLFRLPELFLYLERHPRSSARRLTPIQDAAQAKELLIQRMEEAAFSQGVWRLGGLPGQPEQIFETAESARREFFAWNARWEGSEDG